MSLQIPDKNKYESKLQQIKGLMAAVVPGISRSVGSILYEWVVRPVSIAYASVEEAIDSMHKDNTLNTYKDSNSTNTAVVDDILSNYFVERNGGKSSKGVLTIYSSTPRTTVQAGARFTVGDITVQTSKTIQGVYPSASAYTSTDRVSYVDAYLSNGLFCFNVPVESYDSPTSILPAGLDAVSQSLIPGLDHAVLLSPIEGGSMGETDAALIARARSTVCSWNGGSASIHKILSTSPYTIYSSYSIDSNDLDMVRTTGSPLFMGTSGLVDTYVKTSQLPLTDTVTVKLTSGCTDITKYVPAGVISIDSITDSTGKPLTYDIQWKSSNTDKASAAGARFSSLQQVIVDISSYDVDAITGVIQYTYMPYIAEIQEYISRSDVRPLGMDILIKAAIPAVLTIRGRLSAHADDKQALVEALKTYVNSKQVSDSVIDIADVNKYLNDNFNGLYITSPAHITSSSTTTTHDLADCTDYTFSTSGLLELETVGIVSKRMKFFCLSDMGVHLE